MVTIKTKEQGEALEKILGQYLDLAGVVMAQPPGGGELHLQHPTDATSWRIFVDGSTRSL